MMRISDEWCCMNCALRNECLHSKNSYNLLDYCDSYIDEDDTNDSYTREDLEDW
ncbi:unknown [Parabacteroides sp. CAG:2]|nr:unknown [Parabacteroides sp. CAG:2]DAV65557.1 MAG TPA: hypothetical protein [Caudoviricetes sp.]